MVLKEKALLQLGLTNHEIILQPQQARVETWHPDDSRVKEEIFPMIDFAFSRYTIRGDGLNDNGQYILLAGDQYDVPGKATVFTCMQNDIPLGSFRVVNGIVRPDIQPPIDAMGLMTSSQWENLQGKKFGEFGRFVVNPSLTKKEEGLWVLRQLFCRAMEFAQTEGMSDNIFVILAAHVANYVGKAGIQTELVADASLNLNDPVANRIFSLFPRYWLPQTFEEYYKNGQPAQSPKLYRYLPQLQEVDLRLD